MVVSQYTDLSEMAACWPSLSAKFRLCLVALACIMANRDKCADGAIEELHEIEALADTDTPN